MNADKNILRVSFRKIRKNAKSHSKDELICDALLRSVSYTKADTVFLYSALGSEVDTGKILDFALFDGKKVAFPKCLNKDGEMTFYLIESRTQLRQGMFSIKEPDESFCKKAVYSENSLCVVPGLAFDEKGFRLGYGKGYYDRFLSGFKGISVGICYDECFCRELPSDKYDIRVDMIITDKKIIDLSKEE